MSRQPICSYVVASQYRYAAIGLSRLLFVFSSRVVIFCHPAHLGDDFGFVENTNCADLCPFGVSLMRYPS